MAFIAKKPLKREALLNEEGIPIAIGRTQFDTQDMNPLKVVIKWVK